ncbi:hypothetical protein VNO80_15777 [Phaseolus coccineus]|uniref:Uncharacterized protein n=1 Tax=Phaseolus coccineus TaxID=3886 RepID=A0AAN9MKW0_PHACN
MPLALAISRASRPGDDGLSLISAMTDDTSPRLAEETLVQAFHFSLPMICAREKRETRTFEDSVHLERLCSWNLE